MVSSAAMTNSLHIRPSKKKHYSNPFMGIFTRSKSQVHLHRNRSGRAWADAPLIKKIHHPHLMQNSPLRKRKRVHCEILENGTSLDLSIKDLRARARARRVFSPATAVVEEKNSNCGVGFDVREENCNGSSEILENYENFEVGFKFSDPDLAFGPGFSVADNTEEKNEDRESLYPDSKDPDRIESQVPANREDNEDLSKITSPMKEKNGVTKVSSSEMILKSSSRRKVFKSPSSFSYRRLLPFLMDMATDDSSTSRIEIVDKDFSCKVEKSINVDSNVSSILMDTDNAKIEDIGEHFDDTKSLVKGDIENVQNKLHVKVQDLHDPSKKLPQTEEYVSLSVAGITNENGITGVDELIEDCVQTTPPDATIFSELDDRDARANGEIKNLKTGNHVLGNPSSESTCSNHMFVLKKSHHSPTRRSNINSTTKPILNPCSRLKIFKTSSSFSYRRLLPFLMDVAKSSANIDQSPNIQKNLESNQHSVLLTSSDKNVPLNKNDVDIFQENQEAKDHEPNFPIPIKVHSVDRSSDDICPKFSTPFSSSSSSNGKLYLASADNISQHDAPNCLHTDRTSLDTHVQLFKPGELEVVLPSADFRVCDGEANCSAETQYSTINHKCLPGESAAEVLQHEQVDIEKNCITQGQDYHEGKANNIKCVFLDQNLSKTAAFSAEGTDSCIRGILKRNQRACRGLCNCLNCASFRLHAERAFEFSRNQMLDAEEVALLLIEELAELRNMLENPAVDGSGLAAIQLNQVREACKKALKTEQQAKQRLSQMTEDLNVHCRITPLQLPRVTFSRYIEEKSIPSGDLPIRPHQ